MASSRRRRSARIFLGIIAILALGCTVSLDFRSYRACSEKPGSNQHDPGTVLSEYLGDGNVRHFRFLADRHKNDDRQVLDLTRVNRFCPLATGFTAGAREPVGTVWDLSGGVPK